MSGFIHVHYFVWWCPRSDQIRVPLFIPYWEIYIHIFSAASQLNPQMFRIFTIKNIKMCISYLLNLYHSNSSHNSRHEVNMQAIHQQHRGHKISLEPWQNTHSALSSPLPTSLDVNTKRGHCCFTSLPPLECRNAQNRTVHRNYLWKSERWNAVCLSVSIHIKELSRPWFRRKALHVIIICDLLYNVFKLLTWFWYVHLLIAGLCNYDNIYIFKPIGLIYIYCTDVYKYSENTLRNRNKTRIYISVLNSQYKTKSIVMPVTKLKIQILNWFKLSETCPFQLW